MDIKEQIEKVLGELTKNAKLKSLFDGDPVKAVEKILGVDLPDELIDGIVKGVKAKLTADTLKDAAGFIKKLF